MVAAVVVSAVVVAAVGFVAVLPQGNQGQARFSKLEPSKQTECHSQQVSEKRLSS